VIEQTSPKPRPCPVCSEEFVPRRIGQKVCSRACSATRLGEVSGDGSRASAAVRQAKSPMVQKTCPVCGAEFEVHYAYRLQRKTCSPACSAKLRATPRGRTGSANPNYRSGRSVGKRPPAAWRNAVQAACESPLCTGSRGQHLHLHHVVYLQALRREGVDLWDPRNAMTLCATCHAKHHHRTRIIPISALPEAAVRFAVQLMGEDRAAAYLARRYAADDPN
jgi:5-methylcytosine-specific restriction endonuclease McrA